MIAVLGAGAMGAALASHWARAGRRPVLLATQHDRGVIDAWRQGLPHPALGVPLPGAVVCRPYDEWPAALAEADMVAACVSTDGLPDVVAAAAAGARPDVIWVLATKGWQEGTLRSPSEVVTAAVGPQATVVSLAGPGLAPEIVVGAPTALVAAATDPAAAGAVADSLRAPTLAVTVTDDLAGAETAAAYKNVVAVAVGICEGLSERSVESAYVHAYANARAAVFAQGLVDMVKLATARGGRAETVLGLAGSGDLYVTCLGGRNGRFGRLLGAGETPGRAERSIGSTVEGVANTAAALALAEQVGVDLPTARAVELALAEQLVGEQGVHQLRHLFWTVVTTGGE